VTRTGLAASASTFSFATADASATTADSDYVGTGGTGTIPAGGASGTTTISVTINGDAVFENDEGFVVNLTAPSNAVISDAQGTGSITNDDAAPTLTINDVSITEGNTGTQNLSFTVTRTGLTALPASFTATTANGTATAPSDYLAALAGSTSIAAGGATGTTTLTATINGDAIAEANETFFVNLTAAGNASFGDNQGLGTITNDDTAGITLTQTAGTTDVTEGGATDTYSLVLTSQPTANVLITLFPGTQVTALPTPLTFTSGNWNVVQTVTVTAVDDAIVEGPHTGTISHTVASSDATYNQFALANVTANITDNDTAVATQLNFGQQPTSSASGASITPALTVRILDVGGTLVDSTANVTLAIGTNPSGGTLSGTATVAAVAGIATFSNLSINTAGAGYTLIASSGDLIGAVSNAFNITTANTAPTITEAGALTRQAGSAATSSVIATVSDLESAAGTLVVTAPSVPGGLSVDGFVNAKGQVSANVAASCLATTGANTVGLSVTDGELASTANLTVTVEPNAPPSQGAYTNTNLTAGGGTTVTPTAAPADNGSISLLTVAAPGFTGTLSVNAATGVVTVANAGPAAIYTVTVTATDNCTATSTRTFQLTVNPPSGGDPTITPVANSRAQGSALYRSVIANVSDAAGAVSVLVTVNGGASATVSGVQLQAIQNNNGLISAAIRGGCFSPISPPVVSFTLTASSSSGSNTASLPITIIAGNNPTWCQWWPR